MFGFFGTENISISLMAVEDFSDVGCLDPALHFFVERATLPRFRINGEVPDEASGDLGPIEFKA